MLLFVLACGLAVTLGVMNFVNLAHAALSRMSGWLQPPSFWSTAGACRSLRRCRWHSSSGSPRGLILERTLYVHVYRKSHLDQVLFTIGLVFMSVAAVELSSWAQARCSLPPDWLHGQLNVFGIGVGRYRHLRLSLVCGLLTLAPAADPVAHALAAAAPASTDVPGWRVGSAWGRCCFCHHVCRWLWTCRSRGARSARRSSDWTRRFR